MATPTVENYLKALVFLQQAGPRDEPIAMGAIARAMDVAPGTATAMIKTLADSGLADYTPRAGVRLTAEGEQQALDVVRRHRLIELFLVDVVGLDWAHVHEEAEALEHAVSDRFLERIDDMLGRPKTDPHGDPIPTAKGKLARLKLQSLADGDVIGSVRVMRVTDQDPSFLQFVERSGLTPGTRATVQTRDDAADAITLKPEGGDAVTLGRAAAAKILIEAA